MVSMRELWEPILLSSGAVFVSSAVIWMALPYHKHDLTGVKNEDALRKALKDQELAPDQYAIPFAAEQRARTTPEFQQKMKDGPLAIITIRAPGLPNMGKMLGVWFVHLLVLSSFIAYVAGRTFGHGAEFVWIFRIVSTVALIGYAGALPIHSIFWGRPWRVTVKDMFDGLLYALITGAIFGWFWPR